MLINIKSVIMCINLGSNVATAISTGPSRDPDNPRRGPRRQRSVPTGGRERARHGLVHHQGPDRRYVTRKICAIYHRLCVKRLFKLHEEIEVLISWRWSLCLKSMVCVITLHAYQKNYFYLT